MGVKENSRLIQGFEIYPNPSKNNPAIGFVLSKSEQVKIELLDMTGRHITTIVDDKMLAGNHRFSVQHKLLPGVYLLTLKTANATASKRLIILE